MARVVTQDRWEKYQKLRDDGLSMTAARKQVGISHGAAQNYETNDAKSSGVEWKSQRLGPVIPYENLSKEAKKAWHDFEYFRLRYLGRSSTPWQVEAANSMRDALETEEREWVVANAPPGSGKSTLFTCDIPLWLIVRNRALRVMIGSFAQKTADKYTRLIKAMLELTYPLKAPMNQRGAVDAVATLAHDFGRFEPDKRDLWARDQFIVEQPDARATANKEPSFSSWGHGAAFLGTRYDLIIWDDLVEDTVLRSATQREYQQEWWDNTAETRLEPGGVMVLNGQRMGSEDLYHYNLTKLVTDEDEDEEDFDAITAEYKPQYRHLIWAAHDESKCIGERGPDGKMNPYHRKDAPYWPDGCLLDPRNVGWRYLKNIEAANKSRYRVQYQQEDVDPEEVLVQKVWLTGGTDDDGNEFPGCYDYERELAEPIKGLAGRQVSVLSVDPSPSNYWAVEWWLLQTTDDGLYTLMDLHRGRLQYPEFFEEDPHTRAFTGILPDWYARSVRVGHPLTHVIFEANAAQKFMLQQESLQRWAREHKVQLVSHYTSGKNKGDPEYGVQSLGPLFRTGRVRLPMGSGAAKLQSGYLTDEATRYNTAGGQSAATDDTIMSMWFAHWCRRTLVYAGTKVPQAKRPTWMSRRRQR